MNHRKHGFGLLGGLLTVAALGLMLFAAGAQAKTAKILYLKPGGGAIAFLHASASGDNDGLLDNILLVKALNFEIRCHKFTVQEGLVLTATDADARLLYEGCEPLQLSDLKPISACHILDPLDKVSLHITASALLAPIELTSGDFGILASSISATVLMTGAECVLPEKTLITGQVCGLIEPTSNDTDKLLLLFSEAIQLGCLTGATHKLSFGAQTSYIDGRANVFLIGDHLGYKLLVEL